MHKLTNLDPEQRTAVCAECGPVRVRLRGEGAAFRCNNSGRQGSRGSKGRKNTLRDTPEGKALLAKSNGCCEICGQHFEKLCVDHDHQSGEIRGLLCHHCNVGIGFLGDDVERLRSAIEYLDNKRPTQHR